MRHCLESQPAPDVSFLDRPGISSGRLPPSLRRAKLTDGQAEQGTLPLRQSGKVFHPAASSPMSSPLTHGGRDACKAFTLIELLTVITIIGVLAGLTFGVARGVSDKGRIGRAEAELAALATGMEEYRHYFGDYLHVSASETATGDNQIDPKALSPTANDRAYNLFRALNGYISPDHTLSKRRVSLTNYVTKYARSFVEVGQFTLERDDISDSPGSNQPLPKPNTSVAGDDPSFANAFLDPWGNRYIYFYKDTLKQARWKRNGFILLSAGPDGKVKFKDAASRETGDAIDATDPVNRDNIYATP